MAAKSEAEAANAGTKWPLPVVELFLGKKNPEETVAAADNDSDADSVCEARFYTGEWYLLRGIRDKAREAFQGAFDIRPREFIEFAGAQAELKQPGR